LKKNLKIEKQNFLTFFKSIFIFFNFVDINLNNLNNNLENTNQINYDNLTSKFDLIFSGVDDSIQSLKKKKIKFLILHFKIIKRIIKNYFNILKTENFSQFYNKIII
jgi:hypothetical protein